MPKEAGTTKSMYRGENLTPAAPETPLISWKTAAMCSTPEARELIPYNTAEKLEVLPLGVIKSGPREILTVAAAVRNDRELTRSLKFTCEKDVHITVIDKKVLKKAIYAAYNGDDEFFSKRLAKYRTAEETPDSATKEIAVAGSESGACSLLEAIIKYAISKNASDLHIIPVNNGGQVSIRIDGLLYTHKDNICSTKTYEQLISRTKILSDLDTSKRFLPQDGSFKLAFGGDEINVRVSTVPTIHGEKAVLRFLKSNALLSLSELGMERSTMLKLKKFLSSSEGMCLFAGPTGSGKSTTMYAALDFLRHRPISLITIEDPVEIDLEGIPQIEINEKRGLSFPVCLRSVLRQDPDVILLGEIRDEETARIALHAAQTGHLILSTVHAGSVEEVLRRLTSLGIDTEFISCSLKLIICQRLVPKPCPHCAPSENRDVSASSGCRVCRMTGYAGRSLRTEFMCP